jgi:hypothetical protein
MNTMRSVVSGTNSVVSPFPIKNFNENLAEMKEKTTIADIK